MSAFASIYLPPFSMCERLIFLINTEAEAKFYRRLNDERNPGLAAGIDKLHRDGKRVFAAVGALHMTGPKALPTLLANMGYKVERVVFEIGK